MGHFWGVKIIGLDFACRHFSRCDLQRRICKFVKSGIKYMSEQDEIEKIRQSEARRGRRQAIDLDYLEERRQIERVVRELIKAGDEQGFRELLIRRLGISEDSRQFAVALSEFWNSVRESEKRGRGRP
jgi:hypothetical protein